MPYNSETSQYERRAATVIDATPDGDTVAIAIDVKLDQGIDDYVTDLNHHAANGNHYPATSVGSDSRFLKQSPAGVVSWADGVVAADAALKDMSNVASGTITSAQLVSVAPAKITQDASNRFVTDAEKSTWNGALYDKADVEGVLTGTIASHTHSAASESAVGLVELATTVEAAAGTDTSRAVTAAGVDAYHKANNINLGVSYAVQGTETSIDFGSVLDPIPVGVKRITVAFDGISTNGSSNIQVQIGAAGSPEASGYAGGSVQVGAGGAGALAASAGVPLSVSNAAALSQTGNCKLFTVGNNAWNCESQSYRSDGYATAGHCTKTIAAALGVVRITTVNGTDVFDAGTINISWEF